MNAPPPLPPGKVREALSRGDKVAIVVATLIAGTIVMLGLLWLFIYILGLMFTGGGGAGGN
jgi:hypothetical protein